MAYGRGAGRDGWEASWVVELGDGRPGRVGGGCWLGWVRQSAEGLAAVCVGGDAFMSRCCCCCCCWACSWLWKRCSFGPCCWLGAGLWVRV